MKSILSNPWLLGGLIVVLTVGAYLPALPADYIWDDNVYLTENPEIKAPGLFFRMWSPFHTKTEQYYPLTATSFWLEYRLWGAVEKAAGHLPASVREGFPLAWLGADKPAGYHATNILLHALASVLLWRVLRQLGVPGAWLAGLLFALHPVNVASVAWITERKNTQSLLFTLLTVWAYLRYARLEDLHAALGVAGGRERLGPGSFYALSLAFFLCALLTKTAVVSLPAAMLLCLWWQRRRIGLADVLRIVPFLVLSALMVYTTFDFEYRRAQLSEPMVPLALPARLPAVGWIIWFYLFKAVLPTDLLMVYSYWPVNPWLQESADRAARLMGATSWPIYPWGLLTYAPLLGLLAATVLFLRHHRSWGRPLILAFGFFVILLAPVLGFFTVSFHRYALVADHWQYVSLAAVAALAVGLGWWAAARWRRIRWPATGLAALTVGLFFVLTWRQTLSYDGQVTLWTDNTARGPCWVGHYNLGVIIGRWSQVVAASPEGARGADGRPWFATWRRHRAACPLCRNNQGAPHSPGPNLADELMDATIAHYRQEIAINPRHSPSHYNLGVALSARGRIEESIASFRRATEEDPRHVPAYNNLANLLASVGRTDEALRIYDQAVEALRKYCQDRKIDPKDIYWRQQEGQLYNNIGSLLLTQGRNNEAFLHFNQALHIDPKDPLAHNNLGLAYAKLGDVNRAAEHYLRAAELYPPWDVPHYHMGVIYSNLGRFDEAIVEFEKAIQRNPANASAHGNLAVVLAKNNRLPEAIAHCQEQVRLSPTNESAYYNLAMIQWHNGSARQATDTLRRALQVRPEMVEAMTQLARILGTARDASVRNPAEAVVWAEKVNQATGDRDPVVLDILAACYGAAARFNQAVRTAERAARLAAAAGQTQMADQIRTRLQLYQDRKPFIDSM